VERSQLLLPASGDFTTRVTGQPLLCREEDDIEDSKLFEGLEEETASRVAEYAAKGGKYGIVPPPAQPRQAPVGDVMSKWNSIRYLNNGRLSLLQ
jgi:hypothetical protein